MDINIIEQEISNTAEANFVLLSLYREYSIIMLNDENKKEECRRKMQQIKKDIRYLSEKELINKVKNIYLPLLQKFLQQKRGRQ